MDSLNWPPQFGNSSDGQTSSSFSSFTTHGGGSSFQGFPDFGSLPQSSSFSSSTQSYSLDSSKTFYLASVSNGHVLAHQENARPSGVVVENKGDRGDEQKWTVESGDEPNTIALKCSANGKYLHCFEGKSWGKVGTGDKQWWKISDHDVSPPGACRLCPVDYPDVFLNHHSGNTVRRGAAGTKVHMYKWEQNNERHTTWYFTDTSANFNPAASSVSSGGASKADFDSKLKALEEREATLTQKDKDRSAEWDKKMKELQDRQEASTKDEKDRAATYEKKLKDLQAREDELAKNKQKGKSGKEQSGKDADTQRKLDDLKSTEQKVAADRSALEKSKNDLAAKEKEFQQRQKEFEDQKAAAQQDAAQAKKDLENRQKEVEGQKPAASTGGKTSQNTSVSTPNGSGGSTEADLQKKQRENANLEQRLAKLEDQLAQMSASSSAAEKPQGNDAPKGSTANGAGPTGCGYKHYRPPRKLNRELLGYVYK